MSLLHLGDSVGKGEKKQNGEMSLLQPGDCGERGKGEMSLPQGGDCRERGESKMGKCPCSNPGNCGERGKEEKTKMGKCPCSSLGILWLTWQISGHSQPRVALAALGSLLLVPPHLQEDSEIFGICPCKQLDGDSRNPAGHEGCAPTWALSSFGLGTVPRAPDQH